MKKQFIFFIVLFIFYVTAVNAASECSDFEAIIRKKCNDLSSPGEYCYYSDNECKVWYQDCEDYNPDNNFNDNICTKINPSNSLKKCVVKNDEYDENKKWCVSENKKCEDHNYKDECVELEADTNKRCVLFNGECKAHFDDCSVNSLNDKEICEKNIPRAKGNQCIWNELSSICQAESRKCKDYIEFLDIEGRNKECSELEYNTDSGAVCYWNKTNNICTEGYLQCEHLTDKTKCNSIIPLNVDRNGFDNLLKCVPTDSECETKKRTCNDYNNNKREEDTEEICKNLSPENEDNRNNKMCILNENNKKCEEIYITCDSYNLVIEENNRIENDCKSIKPRDVSLPDPTLEIKDEYKCILEAKSCIERKKDCNEFNNNEDICNQHFPNDFNKKCHYKDSSCIEIYKNCQIYESQEGTDNINRENCESITPWYVDNDSGDRNFYKCEFKEEGGKHCETIEIKKCEDYGGKDADFCKEIIIKNSADRVKYNCVLKNDKCISQYKDCSTYKADGKKDKKTCEEITLYGDNDHPYPYFRCFLEHDKDCEIKRKLCNEYKGEDENECSKYRASDDELKICVFEDNKCIEKYKEQIYKYCSDYKGTDKFICESIQPHKSTDNSIDYTSKCIYGKDGCERTSIECNEAKDIYECNSIVPTDSNKMCIFKDNKCVEQYRACELYQDNEEKIDKEICESIIIDNSYSYILSNLPGPNYKYKCEFHQGTGNDDNDPTTCKIVPRTCKDFKISSITSECISISQLLTEKTKKCSFINSVCTLVSKTCLDLKDEITVTAEICKASSTSSDAKLCDVDIDENKVIKGCKEVDNPDYVEKTREKKNSGGFKLMNKIILPLFFLLI